MKTCPTCQKKTISTIDVENIESNVRSTKITSIRTSPIVKSSKKATI